MKNIFKILIITLLFLNLSYQIAEGKWWIFGSTEDEITIRYLNVNNVSYDELGPKVTFFRDNLIDGNIVIRGKATIKTGKIASVRISINNKETWQDANLSEDGAFEFRFRPEPNKNYVVFIEIMDTRGKTNDIDTTRKEIILSERNINAVVKDVLDAMSEAYKKEDARKFMSYVAEDFVGDAFSLERAIKKDFSLFDNIDIKFTINNIVSGSKGIVVSINFNRSLVLSKTGTFLSDKGMTEFVFKFKEGNLKLYSMKFPLIFGLSDAGNVATGVVQNPNPKESIIVVNERGQVFKEPFDQAVNTIREDTTSESGTFTLNYRVTSMLTGEFESQGFSFEDGIVVNFTNFPPPFDADIYIFHNEIAMANGTLYKNLGKVGIDNVKELSDTGYETYPMMIDSTCTIKGNVYAIKLKTNKYALIEIIDCNLEHMTYSSRALFKYKYQPDGSRRF